MTPDKFMHAILSVDTDLLPCADYPSLSGMLRDHLDGRIREANQKTRREWAHISNREEWERFLAPRIEALRQSLGELDERTDCVDSIVTSRVSGDGFQIENLVYRGCYGMPVSGNLYLPADPRQPMPAFIIIHSHHQPKTQGELQDMGMTWARNGCAVLVIDQLSYGERRQHQDGKRQDYRFRYFNGIQLSLIGSSLVGWMVRDTMRGIDLLCQKPDIDRDRLVLLGAVAGGGDPAAIVAALDSRITCSVPFNFGGPQPETRYPLPENSEERFNDLGNGSWESTRGLYRSGCDGFPPWVIVGAVCPRCLIYAHEFSWDAENDPVWRRLRSIYNFFDADERISSCHGSGRVTERPPAATHCNQIGEVHRSMIHPALESFMSIPVPDEYSQRLPEDQLQCMTAETETKFPHIPQHQIYAELAEARASQFRDSLSSLPESQRQEKLCRAWAKLLGDIEPSNSSIVRDESLEEENHLRMGRVILEVEPGIIIPILFLLPKSMREQFPIIVGISQAGKAGFWANRSDEIQRLLASGVAVCLPDLRGTGETAPQGHRGRQSEATSISATELMLGQTLMGSRLRDLRSVLRYLHGRDDLQGIKVCLWGDSFSPTNPPGFADPLIGEEDPPEPSEPLGGLLALLGALFEPDVFAVVARGMFAGYASILKNRFCYVPHDVIVPGALTVGDLCDIASALSPRPLRLEALVDGRNCVLPLADAENCFSSTRGAYRESGGSVTINREIEEDLADWINEATSAHNDLPE